MSNKLISALMSFRDRLKNDPRSSVQFEGDWDTLCEAIEELKRKGRPNIHTAVQRACNELPEGWEIVLRAEYGAGTVELFNPDGDEVDFNSSFTNCATSIEEAVAYAVGAST